MRNPDRLDSFYDEVKKIHKQYFPDMRFGQLFSSITNWLWIYESTDIFNLEEDQMVKRLKDFADFAVTCGVHGNGVENERIDI